MSFPQFTALREIGEYIRTGLDAIKASIDGMGSQGDGVNLVGTGSTVWSGSVQLGQIITLANQIDYVTGDLVYYKASIPEYSKLNLNIGRGDDQFDGNITARITAGGDLQVEATFEDLDVILSFTPFPLLGGGLVGPQGASGVDGQDGTDGTDGVNADVWGIWRNITLDASTQNADVARPSRYRTTNINGYMQILVQPVTSWSGTVTIGTILAAARPTQDIPMHVVTNESPPTIILGSIDTTGNVRLFNTTLTSSNSVRALIPYPKN